MFSPAYPRHVGPTSLQYRLSFNVGKAFCGHRLRQTMPSCHGLNYSWGEHWIGGIGKFSLKIMCVQPSEKHTIDFITIILLAMKDE